MDNTLQLIQLYAMLTTVKFLKELPKYEQEQPYELYGFPVREAGRITNCEFEYVHDLKVASARLNMYDFKLEDCGFQYVKHESKISLTAENFEMAGNQSKVVLSYLEETIDLVKQQTSASQVICFDWRFRRNSPSTTETVPVDEYNYIRYHPLPVGATIHCDFSYDGGYDRIGMHLLPDELAAVEEGRKRVMIVNAWRPLSTVKNAPLLLSDRRSIRKKDLVEVDKVLPDKVEKAFFLYYRKDQKWFYLPDQEPNEVAFFVTWRPDEEPVMANYSPHGASGVEVTDTRPRESVEVRMMVFFDHEKE